MGNGKILKLCKEGCHKTHIKSGWAQNGAHQLDRTSKVEPCYSLSSSAESAKAGEELATSRWMGLLYIKSV